MDDKKPIGTCGWCDRDFGLLPDGSAREPGWILRTHGPVRSRCRGSYTEPVRMPSYVPKVPPHVAEFVRFRRGMTPIAPSRPIYGYEVRCSCGTSWRVNESKPTAQRQHKAHAAT